MRVARISLPPLSSPASGDGGGGISRKNAKAAKNDLQEVSKLLELLGRLERFERLEHFERHRVAATEGRTMASIKHIAIRTGDVEKTAAFYKDAFGLKQVGLGQNGIYLTDGHLNIAVLKFQPGKNGEPLRLGVDHVGFQVDDVDATIARINGLGGKPLTDRTEVHPTDPSRPQSYYEIKCVGPDEQVIDVSNVGWVGAD
jgi:lactoylglutathione lyase